MISVSYFQLVQAAKRYSKVTINLVLLISIIYCSVQLYWFWCAILCLLWLFYVLYLYNDLLKLFQSTKRELRFYKTVPAAFLMLPEWGKIKVSHSAEKLLGMKITSAEQFQSLLCAEEKQGFKAFRENKQSLRYKGNITIVKEDGNKLYIKYIAVQLYSKKGGAVIWLFHNNEEANREQELACYLNFYRDLAFDLNLLVHSLPVAMWRISKEGEVIFKNQYYCDLLTKTGCDDAKCGLFPSEILNRNDDVDEIAVFKNLVINGELVKIKIVEKRLLHLQSIVGYAFSLSEQQHLEKQVSNLNSILRGILASFPQGVLILDSAGQVISANNAFVKIFDISEVVTIREMNFSALLDLMRDRERLPESKNYKILKDEYLALLNSSEPHPGFYMHLPDNTTIWVTTIKDEMFNTILVFDNVSEGLKMERSYHDLLVAFKVSADTSREPIAIFGQDLRLRFFNTRFQQLMAKDQQHMLEYSPKFKDLLPYLNCGAAIERINNSFEAAMHARQEQSLDYIDKDNSVSEIIFKPLPDNTVLIRLYLA